MVFAGRSIHNLYFEIVTPDIYSRIPLFRKSAYSKQRLEKKGDFLNLKTGKLKRCFSKDLNLF